ncbi:MAG TPA: hypothetical protein VGA36_10350 [Nitriliruptorales bacterium]
MSPASGQSWRAADPQLFTVRASDPDGDPYHARVTVTNTSNGQTTTFETALAPSGQNSSGAPVPPLAAGSYTWSAVAIDDQGAVSGPSTSRSLTVLANRAPGTPTQVTPEHDGTFGPAEPQVFAARASDPDGDVYRAEIRIKQGTTVKSTFTTGAVPSGMDAYGVPPQPLPAGFYSWEARAIDVAGASSTWSGPRDFTVAAAPENQPPSIGSRSPSSGHTFGRDEPQVFSVTASDPEGDPYSGEVTVRKASNTALVTQFATSPAASGTPSAGSPVPALEPGEYTWTVTVSDPAGSGQSVTSSALPFSVAGNQAPGTPTLRSPSPGASFAPEDPQVFTIRSSDPDGDAYDGTVIVRNASSGAEVVRFPTWVANSGQDSTGTPPVPLSAGSYTWAAHAHDVFGATSADTSPRSFTVEAATLPPPPPNDPPGTPTLVAPGNGSSWTSGEPVVFTIRASDPDGDVYVGEVTVRDASSTVVARFDTAPAASGSDSSGVPVVPLQAGSYSWTARAIDPAGSGSYGPTSSSRSFTVEAATLPPPPPNDPPGAPTLVSPVDGHGFGAAEPQVFTVRATDPDGDVYVGEVTVRNAFTNQVVTSFATAPAASGSDSTGTAEVPLEPGSYTWSATASDPAGSGQDGPASASRSFAVEQPVIVDQGECFGGTSHVDGYVADSYLRVASEVSGDTAMVCLRFDDGTAAGAGGELSVTAPEGASLPVISTSTAVCDTAGSEPVPQPLLNGSVGDPGEPETYVRFFADVRLDGDEVSVCVKAGTQGSDTSLVSRAITITVPDAGDVTPDVNFAPYTGGAPLPAEAAHDDMSQASAACQTATSGELTRLLNLAVDGVRTYLYAHTDTELARACVRVAGGPQEGGGTASIDTSGFPGVTPIADVLPGVGPGDADAPCSVQVIEIDNPLTVHVHRSGTGDIPAALCTRVASNALSVQLGFEGDPAATPTVGFTPDT